MGGSGEGYDSQAMVTKAQLTQAEQEDGPSLSPRLIQALAERCDIADYSLQ